MKFKSLSILFFSILFVFNTNASILDSVKTNKKRVAIVSGSLGLYILLLLISMFKMHGGEIFQMNFILI